MIMKEAIKFNIRLTKKFVGNLQPPAREAGQTGLKQIVLNR